MSKNINQIFIANPTATFVATDLMYLGRSPYGATDDFAFQYSSLIPITTKGDLFTFSTGNARLAVAVGNGKILQVNSAAATGLAYSTPTYPSASGSAGLILRSDGTNNIYSQSSYPDLVAQNNILFGSAANTVSSFSSANSAVLVSTVAGVPGYSATMTNGQVIVGSTGATPTAATIGSSGNIAITVGAGTLSIGTTGFGSFAYNSVAGTTQAAAVNNGYIISNAGQTTVTLPATAALGSVVAVQGRGAAGWILAANTGQIINLGSSPTSSAGSLTSTNLWDAVEVVCVVANTTWAVKSLVGNLTVA